MYIVLESIMRAEGITVADLADFAVISPQSVYNKLSGKTDWKLNEMTAIQSELACNYGCDKKLDLLFFNSSIPARKLRGGK